MGQLVFSRRNGVRSKVEAENFQKTVRASMDQHLRFWGRLWYQQLWGLRKQVLLLPWTLIADFGGQVLCLFESEKPEASFPLLFISCSTTWVSISPVRNKYSHFSHNSSLHCSVPDLTYKSLQCNLPNHLLDLLCPLSIQCFSIFYSVLWLRLVILTFCRLR